MSENKIICEKCREEITSCDRCGDEFEEGSNIICCSINWKVYHFCDEECMYDFFSNNDIFVNFTSAKKVIKNE